MLMNHECYMFRPSSVDGMYNVHSRCRAHKINHFNFWAQTLHIESVCVSFTFQHGRTFATRSIHPLYALHIAAWTSVVKLKLNIMNVFSYQLLP